MIHVPDCPRRHGLREPGCSVECKRPKPSEAIRSLAESLAACAELLRRSDPDRTHAAVLTLLGAILPIEQAARIEAERCIDG